MSPAPTCPRCRSNRAVVRRPGSVLWTCAWCARWQWVEMLYVEQQRVLDEADRITKDAA